MELDLELCRKILQKVEKEGCVDGLEKFPSLEGVENDFTFYQIKKLQEAGYVKFKRYCEDRPYSLFRIEITYLGHGFLKEMLNDNVWNKTKEVIKEKGLPFTFEVIKMVIPFAVKNILGIDIG